LRDLSRCAELPDVSLYRVNRTFTPSSSSTFEKIKEAVAAKLTNTFFGEVKLCIDLTSSEGDYERLLTPGLTDCAPAEIKLGIHVDYAAGKVWLNMDVRDNYLQEYTGKWQAKAQQYESYWGRTVDMDNLRRQVISDLEDVQTAQSFFDNLVQSANAFISDKIAGFVEGVQVSQKIAKNVWNEGAINRSTWHSSESEHNQWPGYAQFHPITGGVSDGFIGEIVGIPVAIKGIYGIMTDREQQQAMLALFSKEGVNQLIETLKSEAQATLNDGERLEHFSAQTVIEVSTMLSGMGVTQIGKMGELAETATEGLGKFKKLDKLKSQIDNIVSKAGNAVPIKKAIKEFFEKMDPKILEKLVDVPGFDTVVEDMTVYWTKFHGGKFQLNYAARLVEDGKTIRLEVSNLSDNLKRIYDIEYDEILDGITHTRRLELKNWDNFYPETVKSQFVKDLQKMENAGDVQWIFNKTSTITDMQTLKTKVISVLKKADGSPIDELNVISVKQIEKLFPKDVGNITDSNKLRFLLQKLEDNNVFDQIFEIVE
jgi:hypothetical protein